MLASTAVLPKFMAMATVRQMIAAQVRDAVGAEPGTPLPIGPGLFAPAAVARRVHGDVATMMIGGVAALMMQMLHPEALAGVWDHSNFRKDSAGRLRRTAQFIGGTTYGNQAFADGLIGRVNRIHAAVRGVLPDGTPYFANDPAVLNWVHVAGADAFLRAYVRYREPGMGRDDQDRYFAETAVVARRLGAAAVPETQRGVAVYLRDMRTMLRADERTRDVIGALLAQPAPNAAAAAASKLMIAAGIDLLPGWARDMHRLRSPLLGRPAIRTVALGIGGVLHWAMAAPAIPPRPSPRRSAAG